MRKEDKVVNFFLILIVVGVFALIFVALPVSLLNYGDETSLAPPWNPSKGDVGGRVVPGSLEKFSCEAKLYKDGDAYIGENQQNPNYRWKLANLLSNQETNIPEPEYDTWSGPILSVYNNFVDDKFEDDPPGEGEGWNLPHNYGGIYFDDLREEDFEQEIELELNSDDLTEVISYFDGVLYEIKLVSASDTAATIQVTNLDIGEYVVKEINEGASKEMLDLFVYVDVADEFNGRISTTLVVSKSFNYLPITIEYKENVDTTIARDSTPQEYREYLRADAKTVHIYSRQIGNSPIFDVDESGISTNEIWIQSFRNSNNKRALLTFCFVNEKMQYCEYDESGLDNSTTFTMLLDYDVRTISYHFNSLNGINLFYNNFNNYYWESSWAIFSGDNNAIFKALGNAKGVAETNELYWYDNVNFPRTYIGYKNFDMRTIDGTIIRNPFINSISDKVVLDVNPFQVSANSHKSLGVSSYNSIVVLGAPFTFGHREQDWRLINALPKITFDGRGINVHEELDLSLDDPSVETSLTSKELFGETEDGYDKNVYMETLAEKIKYAHAFDDAIDLSTVSEENPLIIRFLGQCLKIVGVPSDSEILVKPCICGDGSGGDGFHTACYANSCVSVQGEGQNECFTDYNCGEWRYVCSRNEWNRPACLITPGYGDDECRLDKDCIDSSGGSNGDPI